MQSKIYNRQVWIDLLNVTATISVVLMHCTNDALHHFSGSVDLPFIIGLITHSIAYWAVPVFIMISGCNLIGYRGGWKRFYRKRWEKTGIPFLCWSAFYYVINFHCKLPINEFLTLFINGKLCGTMWFFIPLFSVYLSMPFLSILVTNSSTKMLRIYLCIAFFTVSLIPCILDIFNIPYTIMFPIGSKYLFLAVMGYCIARDEFFLCHKRLMFNLGFIAVIFHLAILSFVILYLNKDSKFWLHIIYPTNIFISASVFLWFRSKNWSNVIVKYKVSSNLIQKISSCSLGIYLIHPFLISMSNHFNLGIANPYFGFIILYLFSLSFIFLLKKIPFVAKIVP